MLLPGGKPPLHTASKVAPFVPSKASLICWPDGSPALRYWFVLQLAADTIDAAVEKAIIRKIDLKIAMLKCGEA